MLLAKLIIEETETEFLASPGGLFQGDPDELKQLALCANSPWSYKDEVYKITYNIDDASWECEHKVVGYDAITSIIYGYGYCPENALCDCIETFDELQLEYNNEKLSF
jgi:hypothetical protein